VWYIPGLNLRVYNGGYTRRGMYGVYNGGYTRWVGREGGMRRILPWWVCREGGMRRILPWFFGRRWA